MRGAFTAPVEVDSYLQFMSLEIEGQKVAQARMREEVTYARDSSRDIPRTSKFFKIMIKDAETSRRRLKTAAEFAQCLTALLGKQISKKIVSNEDFESATYSYNRK